VRGGIAAVLRSGLIAGLLVAGRDIPLDAFRLDLQEPLVFVRASALVLVVYGSIGALLGLVGGGLVALIAALLRRRWSEDVRLPVGIAALALGGLVLATGGGEGGTSTGTWIAIATLVVLVEAVRRAGIIDLSRPASGWVPPVAGMLVADFLFFGVQRLVLERRTGGTLGEVLLSVAAVLAAAVVGYLAFLVLAWLCRSVLARRSQHLATAVVLIFAAGIIVLAGWQLLAGESRLRAHLARSAAVLAGDGATDARPNVILISIDALRGDFPGYMGGPAKTPVLDAVAEESFVFERAYSVAPWTRPSFAAFFSGLYPSEMGVGRTRGIGEESADFYPVQWSTQPKLLPEVLAEAGYSTVACVTNGNLTHEAHADQGFQLFYHTNLHPGIGLLRLATRPLGIAPFSWENLERAHVVTREASMLAAATRARPMLMWVHYMDPHQPYDAPDAPPAIHTETTTLTMAGAAASAAPERRRFVDAYIAEIEYCDRWLGRLIKTLKAEGVWDNSLVVLWSDHGEEFWEHGGVDHGHSLFDELLHVPLMIRLSGRSDGRRITDPVSLLDVMPTLLELCGVDVPEGCHGRNLAPLLQDEPGGIPPLRVFLEGCRRGAIRKGRFDGRYKLIYDTYHDSFSLYDLRDDPRERHDIWATSLAPDEAAQWEDELRAWTEMTLALMAQRAGTGAEEVSEEIRQQLRDMGYVQ